MTYFYMATEYSRYEHGPAEAYAMACRQAAVLMRAGIVVFSPIAHGHGIALNGAMGTDVGAWRVQNTAMMDAATGLIVVQSGGWTRSVGIAEEIKYFKSAGKPVVFMVLGIVPEALELKHAT